MAGTGLIKKYELLKEEKHYYSGPLTNLITEIFQEALAFLQNVQQVSLVSKVAGKSYFAYKRGQKLSRPINQGLFTGSLESWKVLYESMTANNVLNNLSTEEIDRTIYTMAIAFCAAIDLIKSRDQKTPGTFFERLIAYFFTWRVGVEPTTSILFSDVDKEQAKLPTDFIFDLGLRKRKFHLPIKTSSRERAIMLWAHQRLLDGVFGMERYMGTPVLLAETKLDIRKKEVVEICVPDQWRVYQLYISRLKRIYYLDVPVAYARLRDDFPPLVIKPFGDFFTEWESLMPT